MTESADSMLTEAIAAVRAGDQTHARELLTRLLRTDSSNPEYWLWLSAVVESERERIYCLQSVLKQDPTNRAALRGLAILGGLPKDQADLVGTLQIPHRKVEPPTRTSPINVPGGRWILLAVPAVFLLGVVLILNFLFRPRATSVAPTIPPPSPTLSPTPAVTATHTPVPIENVLIRTPIPSPMAGTPLAVFAGVLPTSTPYWGVTRDSVYEAYKSSVDALMRGEYQNSIQYMEQVIQTEPTLADAYFIRGEAYRKLALYDEATAEYQKALEYNPTFAVAHLGLARVQLIRDPNVLPDEFNKAIQFDVRLLPAYLEQSDFLAEHGQWGTLEELASSGLNYVASPRLELFLAEAFYHLGRYDEALDHILQASSNDESLLKAYYLLGQTLIALGRYDESLSPLQTYLAYANSDIDGWNSIAAVYYNLFEFSAAEEAYDYALALDEDNFAALYGRGLLYMDRDRYQDALTDFDRAKEVNPQSDKLEFARARLFFAMNDQETALESLDIIFERSLEPNILADAYALQALYFINQSPPYISEAIANWEIILQLENVSEDRKTRAENELTTLYYFP